MNAIEAVPRPFAPRSLESFRSRLFESASRLVGAQALTLAPMESPALIEDGAQSPHFQRRPHEPMDPAKLAEALARDPVAERILAKNKAPADGQLVGARLNLNVLKATGVAVQTLHQAPVRDQRHLNKGYFTGEAIHYQAAVALRDAYFNVDQSARELIAKGERPKSPMASVDGAYDASPIESLDGVEISFNPIKTHLFTDPDGRALRFAERVVIVGHRAYASGRLEWHSELTAPERPENAAPSLARVASAPSPALCRGLK